jgi:hypothetical protein
MQLLRPIDQLGGDASSIRDRRRSCDLGRFEARRRGGDATRQIREPSFVPASPQDGVDERRIS